MKDEINSSGNLSLHHANQLRIEAAKPLSWFLPSQPSTIPATLEAVSPAGSGERLIELLDEAIALVEDVTFSEHGISNPSSSSAASPPCRRPHHRGGYHPTQHSRSPDGGGVGGAPGQ